MRVVRGKLPSVPGACKRREPTRAGQDRSACQYVDIDGTHIKIAVRHCLSGMALTLFRSSREAACSTSVQATHSPAISRAKSGAGSKLYTACLFKLSQGIGAQHEHAAPHAGVKGRDVRGAQSAGRRVACEAGLRAIIPP